MPAGGTITLATSVKSVAQGGKRFPGLHRGPYVVLTVTDTGCGMDASTKARLFEPFFTTKPSGKGTGLGMSTVYRIVHQAGGTVVVESEPGKGTRVSILLPACRDPQQVEAAHRAEPVLDGRGRTVLLVEDDASVRSALEEMLSESGYKVLVASNSGEATRLARRCSSPISLLITDVVMPGGCGCDVARQLVRTHPNARVLFISGYPNGNSSATAAAVLLYKPFSRAALARKIGEVLNLPHEQMDELVGLACHGKDSSSC
jgi:CheY-like chemotaxis protein